MLRMLQMKLFGGFRNIIRYSLNRYNPRNQPLLQLGGSNCTRFYDNGILMRGIASFYQTSPVEKPRWRDRSTMELARRIWQIKDFQTSITPILDQWVQEVGYFPRSQINVVIRELRYCHRYFQALEVSKWLTDKRYHPLSSSDVAIRLGLISKVHGIEQVEDYFNNVPVSLKDYGVYCALLSCYASLSSVEKAEILLQRMSELAFARSSFTYNVMLGLYCKTGNMEKADALMQEMDENGIHCDRISYSIRLSAYAAVSDIEGMEKTLTRMESDPSVDLGWKAYMSIAGSYRKVGLQDRALEMLKKCEGLISIESRSAAYNSLMTQYAELGKKDEVLRTWEVYKKNVKVYTSGFLCVLYSLLKFEDLETAEKVFEEWESQDLSYDIRIPNTLVAAYTKKGLLEKAETFVNREIGKGGKPNGMTWYLLATAYLQNDEPLKAAEAMKKAALHFRSKPFNPSSVSLTISLQVLERDGGSEKAAGFVKLLKDNDIISSDVEDRLLKHIKCGNSESDALAL